MSGTVRWTFTDDVADETYTVPINPDGMTSPKRPQKALTFGAGRHRDTGDTRIQAYLNKPVSWDWEFSGAIRSQAHHDALDYWAKKTNDIVITDHNGRSWRVYPTDFLPTDRQPTPRVEWRLRYTFKVKILEELT